MAGYVAQQYSPGTDPQLKKKKDGKKESRKEKLFWDSSRYPGEESALLGGGSEVM